MDLTKLKKEMPFQWRVQSFSKTAPSATCVAYIDARDVANLLDEVCGPENWQDEYKMIGSMLFAGIGIRIGNDWIWKWDTGSESNIEKEKGHVSDSFKRAAVKWGVGRFLYDLPIQKVKANDAKSQYRDVVDDSGKKVWDLTKHINDKLKRPAQRVEPTKAAEPTILDKYNDILSRAAKAQGKPFEPYQDVDSIPEQLREWAASRVAA